MKKLLVSLFMVFGLVSYCFAVPSNTMSNVYNPASGDTLSSTNYKLEENTQASTYNTHTHNDLTALGIVTTGTWAATPIGSTYGGTGNAYGIGLPSGAVFFMISGSCPSGTTDVSATYANKFLKINATAGTSAGVVLTGTSDSHTLLTTEIPSHRHLGTSLGAGGSDIAYSVGSGKSATPDSTTTEAANELVGGGGGHTHTISAATTLEPSSITMICCQVN